MALLLVRRWSAARAWGDRQRWALVFGATVVCMGSGLLGSRNWPRADLIGACVFDLLALMGYAWLARRIRSREAPAAG